MLVVCNMLTWILVQRTEIDTFCLDESKLERAARSSEQTRLWATSVNDSLCPCLHCAIETPKWCDTICFISLLSLPLGHPFFIGCSCSTSSSSLSFFLYLLSAGQNSFLGRASAPSSPPPLRADPLRWRTKAFGGPQTSGRLVNLKELKCKSSPSIRVHCAGTPASVPVAQAPESAARWTGGLARSLACLFVWPRHLQESDRRRRICSPACATFLRLC